MIYYILIVCLIFAINFSFVRKDRNVLLIEKDKSFEKQICMIVAFALIIIATFRSNSVGTDMGRYSYIYYYYRYEELDLFFSLLFKISDVLGLSFSAINFVTAILIYSCVCFVICKYSPNVLISIVLYLTLGLYARSLNMIRQMLAAALLMMTVSSLKEGNFIKFLFWVLLASLCHISAIIFLVVYPLRKVKFGWKTLLFGILLGALIIVFLPIAVKIVSSIIGVDYYSRYFKTDMFNSLELFRLTNIVAIFSFVIFIVFRKKFIERYSQEQKIYNLFLNIYFLYVLLLIVTTFLPSATAIGRISTYFYFSIIFLVPMLLKLVKTDIVFLVTNLIMIIAVVMFYISTSIQLANNIVPYSNIFDSSVFNVAIGVIVISCGIMIIKLSYENYLVQKGKKKYE